MITFKILVVWDDGNTDWFCAYFNSVDEFVKDRGKFYAELTCWSRVVAFLDMRIPDSHVFEYLGEFQWDGDKVIFEKVEAV